MKRHYGADAKFLFASFSGGSDFQKTMSWMALQLKVILVASASCTATVVALSENARSKLSPSYLADYREILDAKPESRTQAAIDFVKKYGTHVIVGAVMGSQMHRISTMEMDVYEKMEQEGSKTELGAGIDFKIISAHGSAQSESDKKRFESFSNNRTSVSESYVGSYPAEDGKTDTWMRQTAENQAPLSLNLVRLDTLVTRNMFDHHVSPETFNLTQQNLTDVITNWCRYSGLPYCIDPSIHNLVHIEKHVDFNSVDFKCAVGKAIAVGMSSRWMPNGTNPTTWVHVGDDSMAHCASPNNVIECSALCATTDSLDRQIKPVDGANEVVAPCPPGHILTSCGMQEHSRDASPTIFSSVVPAQDHCRCTSPGNLSCVPVCMNQTTVQQYEIVSAYGSSGDARAQCPYGTHLLGCGYGPTFVSPPENWYFSPVSDTECVCHGQAMCYAICGVLA